MMQNSMANIKDSTDFSEENTNFKYLLVDQQAKKVYTNNSAWTQYSAVDKNIEELKNRSIASML